MRHKFGYKKLNRTSEHRKALIKNMLNSLIKYEQITTTLPKAKVLKPQADKIITLGKKGSLHNTKSLFLQKSFCSFAYPFKYVQRGALGTQGQIFSKNSPPLIYQNRDSGLL